MASFSTSVESLRSSLDVSKGVFLDLLKQNDPVDTLKKEFLESVLRKITQINYQFLKNNHIEITSNLIDKVSLINNFAMGLKDKTFEPSMEALESVGHVYQCGMVILVCNPRTISTAFERSFMARRDFFVLHEPFARRNWHFGLREGIDPEYESCDSSKKTEDYQEFSETMSVKEIKNYINSIYKRDHIFIKDMSHGIYSFFKKESKFFKENKSSFIFLIRNPIKTIVSSYKRYSECNNENNYVPEIIKTQRFDLQFNIYENLKSEGMNPIIVDSKTLLEKSSEVMRLICDSINIPFIPESLNWESYMDKSWEQWPNFFEDVSKSTGFKKKADEENVSEDLFKEIPEGSHQEELKKHYYEQLPFYEKMFEQRLIIPS